MALAGIARVDSTVEAMAAAGMVFDREMLLVAAEDVCSKEIAH